MGIVVWHVVMSLDGFIAGPDDAMEWVFGYDWPTGLDEVIASIGVLVVGRNTYMVGFKEDQVEGAEEAYGGRWHGPVSSVACPSRPVGACRPTRRSTFLSGDIRAAVDRLCVPVAGDKNVEVLGAFDLIFLEADHVRVAADERSRRHRRGDRRRGRCGPS